MNPGRRWPRIGCTPEASEQVTRTTDRTDEIRNPASDGRALYVRSC